MCLPPRATVEGANQLNDALTTVAATQQMTETHAQHPEASMCQVEIVDRMQGFTLSPEAYIRFRMRPSISAVDANSHAHHCHKPIDLMHLNAKQAKRIASRRAMRDRLSPMAPTPLEADALIDFQRCTRPLILSPSCACQSSCKRLARHQSPLVS